MQRYLPNDATLGNLPSLDPIISCITKRPSVQFILSIDEEFEGWLRGGLSNVSHTVQVENYYNLSRLDRFDSLTENSS